MVHIAKKVFKPSVYDDTRHILENLRAIPEPGGSLSVSNYAMKRRISPAVTLQIATVQISYESMITAVA